MPTQWEREKRAIANRIRQAIDESGMNLQYIADQMGVGKTTVSGWQTGASNVTGAQLIELARVLGRSPAFFLGEAVSHDDELQVLFNEVRRVAPAAQKRVLRRLFRSTITEYTKPHTSGSEANEFPDGYFKHKQLTVNGKHNRELVAARAS